MAVTQVISDSGDFIPDGHWFDEDERLGSQSMMIVSVLGGQGSGKSTLMNKLFGTSFDVASKGSFASATTKGVAAGKASQNELIAALDVEGADARERGRAGKDYVTKCAGFAASLSDVIILNVWHHDLGRLDSAMYTCLEAILSEQAKAKADAGTIKSVLIFAVRDTDDDVSEADVKSMLSSDVQEAWARVNGPGSIDEVFDIDFLILRHMRYNAAAFDASIAAYQKRFLDSSAPDHFFQTMYSKSIPAEGLSTYAKTLWSQVYQPTAVAAVSAEDLPVGSADAIAKADTAFSVAYQSAQAAMAEMSRKLDVGEGVGEKIPNMGEQCKSIVTAAVETMANETADFEDDPSVARKQRELVSILDANLNAIFMKQLQAIQEKCLAKFRTTLADDSPSDYAIFEVDTMFVREAEESVMPESNWSYKNERAFLHSFMEQYSQQRKRLIDAQVTAAQETQQAFRLLQMQQGAIHQIQQQHYGGVSGTWNVGAAYRPPDSNVNISVGYQQGRTNIQISMVPDEQSSLLGPNGFTSGVGPANLGLSFNINV